jgi:tRNA modification GTPase
MFNFEDTICALATPNGQGALAVIRVSGNKAIEVCNRIIRFKKAEKSLEQLTTATIHYGYIKDNDQIIDDVLISLFKNPKSYTGEDLLEISCHGSAFIKQRILELLIRNGARLAEPGEYTFRAYRNGKMDLLQAEAVADLIDSNSEASHKLAIKQMRGGFSSDLIHLREQLLNFISLIELELDFSEEDVEFVDRSQLMKLISEILNKINSLLASFKYGNAIKNGVPVAIIGKPNVGKSTLLNALLNDEKAIVSEFPGTTRDAIEDTIVLNGILFRFIDTAGIRHTTDYVESIGIERTYENIRKAGVILLLIDPDECVEEIKNQTIRILSEINEDQTLILIVNKADTINQEAIEKISNHEALQDYKLFFISAKKRDNIHEIIDFLTQLYQEKQDIENSNIVTNVRHYEALMLSKDAGNGVFEGINKKISTDFIAQDIREILYYIGTITGEISTDEVLGNIFRNFCIGK